MPGRPKNMARKVTELEDLALSLAADTYSAMPEQYRIKLNPDDPISVLWNAAGYYTMMTSVCVEDLADALRAKAGVAEPGPTELLRREFEADQPAAPASTIGDDMTNTPAAGA